MDFDLVADGKKYRLRQRALETEIISVESNIRFYTLSGLQFFRESYVVADAKLEGRTGRKYKINIREKDHWLALLMAFCLECNLVKSGG